MSDPMKTSPLHAASLEPRTTASLYPEPFASRMAGRIKRVLGDRFGIASFGVNLVMLEPGAVSALFHRHSVQDEFIFVVEGELTLQHDDGETVMRDGDCIGFAHGGTAHCLVNHGQATVTYLEIGDRNPGDTAIYPRDDLVATREGGGWRFTHRDGRPY